MVVEKWTGERPTHRAVLIELRDKFVLKIFFGVAHEEVHDRFRDHIHEVLAHNVEVRLDEGLYDLGFDSLPIRG